MSDLPEAIKTYLTELNTSFKDNKVKKRNGKLEGFNLLKIFDTVKRGFGEKDCAYTYANVVYELCHKLQHNPEYKPDKVFDVEDIQDGIEKVLMKNYPCTAKKFIIYREQRKKTREDKKAFDVTKIMKSYLDLEDWRIKENANSGYSIGGLIHHNASTMIAHYWLNNVYTKEIKEAHINTDIHIHDLGFLGAYCLGHSLGKLIAEGLHGINGNLSSAAAKHFHTLVNHCVNYLGIMQNESAGAQAFSSFDTYVAPFIAYDELEYDEVKQIVQSLLFGLNIPSRWSSQSPFTNLTLDLKVNSVLADRPVVIGGKWWRKNNYEKDLVEVNSVSFDSPDLYKYKDFQREMDLFNRAFLELMYEGDRDGRIFSYPIPTINLTRDFDWDSPTAMLLWKLTGKYGTPYFSNFINSDMKPEDSFSMCCRLRIATGELKKRGGGLFGASEHTGSIGVVTLNLPRAAYKVKQKLTGNETFEQITEMYKTDLGKLIELCKDSLEIKRKEVNLLTQRGLFPYIKAYFKDWNNHFSTIGILGMNEACLNLFGKDIGDPECHKFALAIGQFIRDKISSFQEQTGNLYNYESTPGEGTCRIGETLINTNEGVKTQKEIFDEFNNGKEIYVFGMNVETKELELDKVKNVWITSEAARCVKVTFDNGQTEIVTPNERFAIRTVTIEGRKVGVRGSGTVTKKLTWVRADELKEGMSIWSAYERVRENGYKVLNRTNYIHKLVARHKNNNMLENFVGHHSNYDKSDNSYGNIEVMTPEEHKRLHLVDTINSPEVKEYFSHGENNAFYGKHHSEETKRKLSEIKKGRPFISNEAHKRACSIAAKKKPPEKHSKWVKGVNEELISSLYKQGYTWREICNITGYGYPLVQSRLLRTKTLIQTPKNHKVKSVEFLDGEYTVYDMETEHCHNFFIGGTEGVLVHNCYRFAKNDKKQFPDIITAGDADGDVYYTNSTNLPVNYTDDVFLAMDHQDPLMVQYTGGCVFHTFIGEAIPNPETVKKLVKSIAETYHMPYFSITPTFSVCKAHGYIPGEQFKCPQCGADTEVYSRIVGYFRPVSAWNKGKRKEFDERKVYETNIEGGQDEQGGGEGNTE